MRYLMTTAKRFSLTAATFILLLAMLAGCVYPPTPVSDGVGSRAVERQSLLCATESGNCVESWNGSDIVVYSDAGSTQTAAIDGATGDIDVEGDLDFGGDLEIGGVQTVDFNEFGTNTISTNTTTYLVEVLDTTNVMSAGTNSLAAINVDLGIGNSTGGTNNVYGVLIDDITQDAQNTETAIAIGGTGWDIGLDVGGNMIDLDADNDTSITADTDDQIDVEISGADDFRFSANTFAALSGSSIQLATGNYPLEYASAGRQVVYGTSSITGTATATHGLTTVTFALCTLGKQQDANTAGCSLVVSSNTVTLYTYEDDNTTQSTEASVPVHWLVIGTP